MTVGGISQFLTVNVASAPGVQHDLGRAPVRCADVVRDSPVVLKSDFANSWMPQVDPDPWVIDRLVYEPPPSFQ